MTRWRRLRMGPVTEVAPIARHPVDSPTAPRAVEHEGHEHVLGDVLCPQEVGVHPSGSGLDRGGGVAVPGLAHQRGGIAAESPQPAGRPKEHSQVVRHATARECGVPG